jgi:NADH-quinone oxidoreductase subunit M
MIEDFGGLWKQMPIFAVFFIVVALSSIGLPGLNGFVGEFLILVGVFKSTPVYAVVAATGVILAAAYMLWMFQRVMFGEITREENKVLKDLSKREILVMSCVTLFIFWIGIYPQTFLSRIEPSVKNYLSFVNDKQQGGGGFKVIDEKLGLATLLPPLEPQK